MNDTALQQRILELATKAGIDITRGLTSGQYRILSIKAQEGLRGKIDALASVTASTLRTKVLGIKVIPLIVLENKATCKACPDGLYRTLADGKYACDGCGCSGSLLNMKQEDPQGECPKGHWSNKGKPTNS